MTSNTSISTQWHLARRPHGEPVPGDVRRVDLELPPLGADEARVANAFLSVDPYMRGRMNDVPSYTPPFDLDTAMTGGAVGRVVESTSESLPVGTLVTSQLGWRDVAQGPTRAFTAVDDVPGVSPSAHLGVLGLTGLTAYTGLVRIADIREGDAVFVSAAAGAVGSVAGQIARLKGASRVVGSAGSAQKVSLLTEKYGFDAGFDYHDGDLLGQLRGAAPDGIDVYFDNVGGDHLSAAFAHLNRFGRVAVCGAIASYNATGEETGVTGLSRIVRQSLRVEGFTMGDHWDLGPAFRAEMSAWLANGDVVFDETVVDGIDHAFDAFLGLLRGENVGKMVVAV